MTISDIKARHEFNSDDSYKEYLRAYFSAIALHAILSNPARVSIPIDASAASVGHATYMVKQLYKINER